VTHTAVLIFFAGFALAQTSTDSNIAEDSVEYLCSDESLWNSNSIIKQKGHDFRNCNAKWGLKNANDANVLIELYLQRLEKRISDAKKNNDSSTLDQFKRDGLCQQNHSMEQCYNHIKRRVVSHTLQVRENLLSNNRLLTEIADEDGSAVKGANAKSKMLLERVDELRQTKTPQSSKRPCAENPFVPCIVRFGEVQEKAAQPTELDQASKHLVDGTYSVSAVTMGNLKSAGQSKTVEIEDTNRDDSNLKKLIDTRLSSKTQTAFSKQEYARDLEEQKKSYERTLSRQLAGKSDVRQDPVGVHWTAFNDALDQLTQLRQQSTSPDELVSFLIGIEEDPQSKKLTTDGIIRNRLLNP
jgi:hypothetical protein